MIVVDVETTGLSPIKNSIVSIGAVNFLKPDQQFYGECQVFEGAEITAEALAVNGFSRSSLHDPDKESFRSLVTNFFTWLNQNKASVIGGQNPTFDHGFLFQSARRLRLEWKFGRRTVDLASICYGHLLKHNKPLPQKDGRSSLNADAIYRYVGLPDEPRPHNGLTGATMETEAFHRLIYGRPLFNEFERHQLPKHF